MKTNPVKSELLTRELNSSSTGRMILRKSADLAHHPIYSEVRSLNDARTFMEFHVWCVWDFMSLGKAIQIGVGHYDVPWLPPQDASLVAAINEIISGEEADVGPDGIHASHFEIYLKAMREAGASTNNIEQFIHGVRSGADVETALDWSEAPAPAREFVRKTMSIATGPLHGSVAAFCLSREELVPVMFETFIRNLPQDEPSLTTFLWYVRRHIELDNECHGPLSAHLFRAIVGDDTDWREDALCAALGAIEARKTYLDASLEEVVRRRSVQ